MLNNALYADDLYYAADTVEEALKLCVYVVTLLKDAGVNLRNFTSISA